MKLKIKTISGSIVSLDTEGDTVPQLRQKIAEQLQYEEGSIKVVCGGKVVAPEGKLEEFGIKEDSVLVVVGKRKKPATTDSDPEPKRAKVESPAKPAAETKPSAVGETPAARPATDALPAEMEEKVTQLQAMGFPRSEVVAALRASHNNTTRAVEYLCSGNIPDPPSDAGQGLGINFGLAGADSEAEEDEDFLEIGEEDEEDIEVSPLLEALMSDPNIDQIRDRLINNPQLLPTIIQELATQNPQLHAMISENPQELLNALQEVGDLVGDDDEEDEEDEEQGNETGLTDAEELAVGRLMALGFTREEVIAAYVMCGKSEDLAANYLLESRRD